MVSPQMSGLPRMNPGLRTWSIEIGIRELKFCFIQCFPRVEKDLAGVRARVRGRYYKPPSCLPNKKPDKLLSAERHCD